MYVHVRKSGAHRYVYIMEAYRNAEGKVAHRTLEKLGRYDLLLQNDPDFLEKLKRNLKLRGRFPQFPKLDQENKWLVKQGLDQSYNAENESAYLGMPIYAYSNRVLRLIFRRTLNLEYVLSYLQNQSAVPLPFNPAVLIYHRILAKFFAGSPCCSGTAYHFIADSFDLKDEHQHLPALRRLIGQQQERLLSFLLHRALKSANLPQLAAAMSELDGSVLQNLLASLKKSGEAEKTAKLQQKLQDILSSLPARPASSALTGRSFLNEFEALVSKAMLEIIKKELLSAGCEHSLGEIEQALKQALMTVYIPPNAESETLYLKLANVSCALNNRILCVFGFDPPLNCALKNDLMRALKIKYCSNREILGDAVFERFVIPDAPSEA